MTADSFGLRTVGQEVKRKWVRPAYCGLLAFKQAQHTDSRVSPPVWNPRNWILTVNQSNYNYQKQWSQRPVLWKHPVRTGGAQYGFPAHFMPDTEPKSRGDHFWWLLTQACDPQPRTADILGSLIILLHAWPRVWLGAGRVDGRAVQTSCSLPTGAGCPTCLWCL